MKKKLLLLLLSMFLIGGCSISYISNVDDDKDNDSSEVTPETGNESEEEPGTGNENNNEDNPEEGENEETEKPDIIEPVNIAENLLFYPNTLNQYSKQVKNYSYIYEKKQDEYKIYSAYYSTYYDTIYIAYDSISNPTQTLTAKDLHQIERHALHYFETDLNKTDYKDYLKAVLIYPDTYASSCRNNISDSSSININGCANYVGKEAVISLNRLASLEQFYNESTEKIDELHYYRIQPMRYTYAHEFGHISTFFNMSHKNDEDYEDYLSLRLGDEYSKIYPNGLPTSYSSGNDSYYTQPSEILADDFVELFYNTSKKVEEDTYKYTLDAGYIRNSLRENKDIQNLSKNESLYNSVKEYYKKNFLDYSNKTTFDKPVVITSSYKTIEYYESYSEIGKIARSKTINSKLDKIYLIAVGSVTVNKTKYYRVILSNTFNVSGSKYDEKEAGKKMGYVRAGSYTITKDVKIYEINNDRKNSTLMTKLSMAPIEGSASIYVLPYYDFSYVLSLDGNTSVATTYDYLNSNIPSQTYTINIYSFGTLID